VRQVNQNIKFLRKKNKLTQEKFAQAIGIKRSSVGSYEEDRAVPPVEVLAQIASAFALSVDVLLYQRLDIALLNTSVNQPLQDTSQPTEIEIEEKAIAQNEFSDFPLFASLPDPKPPKNQSSIQEFKSPSTYKNSAKIPSSSSGIPYLNKGQIKRFINETDKEAFLSMQVTMHFPFLAYSECFLALDAPLDFPLNESVLLVEISYDLSKIQSGENHILFLKSGDYIYRRLYSQLHIKGTVLCSSDKAGIQSEEIDGAEIVGIGLPKSFISLEMPKPEIDTQNLKTKLNELNLLISRL
jgi:transcriptional regulator with XRE-family HTH domain